MWIFGQVWFACLVGFGFGVGLDWVLQVRPLGKRVAELEARLEDVTRTRQADRTRIAAAEGPERIGGIGDAGQDGPAERFGRYEPATYAAAGAVAEAARPTGLIAAGSAGGSLAANLVDDHADAGPDRSERTEVTSVFGGSPDAGVEDFPGVARLSEAWDEADRTSVDLRAEEPWQPEAPADAGWTQRLDPVPAGDPDADQEYLAFLRSGGMEPDQGPDTDPIAEHQIDVDDRLDADLLATEHGALILGDYDHDEVTDVHGGQVNGINGSTAGIGMNGTFADPAEVTSVLPYALTDTAEDYPGYREDEYQSDGYQPVEYQPVDYEQDDVVEPLESSTPLPRRGGGNGASPRFSPFEVPFGPPDGGPDAQHQSGELTPIQEGGFQPFQKAGEAGPPAGTTDWFDMDQDGPQGGQYRGPADGGLAQRFQPVGHGGPRRELPPAPFDPYGGSVFGGEGAEGFDFVGDDGPAGSLFEPVIAPEPADDYQAAPVANGRNGAQPATRARVDGAAPAGPFGPGSALPLADGSAPGPQYRVKARTSSMVFHTEASPFYDRLEPQVWFRDTQDAQRAGFTSWESPRTW